MNRPEHPALSAQTGALAIVRNVSAFVVACALVCFLIRSLLPFPEVPAIAQKYRHFAKHKDAYNVLFIGSSRFYHQIIPQQFDEVVHARTGEKVRSFNLGYDGMWPPESYYLLRRILALRPQHLRWVVIDMMDVNPQLDARNASTVRQAYWHDGRHTLLAWRHIFQARERTPEDKRSLAIAHGWILLKQWTNLGRGADRLSKLLVAKPSSKAPASPEWAGAEGYFPGPNKGLTGADLQGYLTTVDRLRAKLPPALVAPVLRQAMQEIIREVRAIGAEPIFVIAPTLNAKENFTDLPEGVALLPFNDPNRYPDLFDPAKHYDGWHLNESGAVDFTRHLSEGFSDILQKRAPGPSQRQP